MRAIRYHEHGGPSVLQLDGDVPEPTPDADDVVVRVNASSANPLDTYLREGSYQPAGLPMIPGVDFAGVVDSVGSSVDEFEPGDRVFGTGLGRDVMGTYAEYARCPLDRVAHLPSNVSFAAGGAAGNVAATAWRALFDHADLAPGEVCLVHGASGGVGHVAVQLARAYGATVVGTARPAYHDRVRELGADVVFDYRRPDLESAVTDAVDGVDVVLSHRMNDYLQFNIDVGRPGVRIVTIGGDEGRITDPALGRSKDARIQIMSLYNTPDIATVLRKLATLLEAGDLSVEIARTYPLGDAADAQEAVMNESFLGKLGVDVP